MSLTDEGKIEAMVDELAEAASDDPALFSDWEVSFIEKMQDVVENWHLTDGQQAKLEQIYEERLACLSTR